jgi:hypothetical protein
MFKDRTWGTSAWPIAGPRRKPATPAGARVRAPRGLPPMLHTRKLESAGTADHTSLTGN